MTEILSKEPLVPAPAATASVAPVEVPTPSAVPTLQIVTPVVAEDSSSISPPQNQKAHPIATLGHPDHLVPLAPMLKDTNKRKDKSHVETRPVPSISQKPQVAIRPKIPIVPVTVPPPVPVSIPAASGRQLKINLPSLTELYTGVRVEIHSRVIETLSNVMDRMGDDYGIDPDELKERYLRDLRIVLEQDQRQQQQQRQLQHQKRAASQRTRNPIEPAIRCLARTAGGEQCTRRRQLQNNIEFCGSHCSNQPYGRIDEAAPVVEKKKRGRPRKVDSPYANDDVELQFEIVYEGEGEARIEFIRDRNNNVYEKPDTETIGSLGDLTRVGTYDPEAQLIRRA